MPKWRREGGRRDKGRDEGGRVKARIQVNKMKELRKKK